MRLVSLLLVFVVAVGSVQAQTTRTLSKKISLSMPDGEGKRGASVTWHPSLKKYYASFAGNATFPMAVFGENGSRNSNDDLQTQFDTRGIWYYPTTGMLCANGYQESGWVRYDLDNKGMPGMPEQFIKGMRQPNEQSVGTYNSETDEVWFLIGTSIWTYDPEDGTETFNDVLLYPGITQEYAESHKSEVAGLGDDLSEDYNYTSVISTQKAGAEAGLLNVAKKQIELYDAKTGYLTQVLKLPSGAPELHAVFDFAYANGLYWIFDEDNRSWVGYK